MFRATVVRLTATVLLACCTGLLAADDAPAAPPPADQPSKAPVDPLAGVSIAEPAKPVLDRVFKQYAGHKGLSVVARHRIQAPDHVLHESVRIVECGKPNMFKVTGGDRVIAACDGKTCWKLEPNKVQYRPFPVPKDFPEALRTMPVLGGGSIGGSGGIVAALLSPNPKVALLRDAASVEHIDAGNDDLLIITIKSTPGTLRPGAKIGLFVPKTGPAWIAQTDVIQPQTTVHTRIAFEQWKPMNAPAEAFTLDPEALRLAPPAPPPVTTPVTLPESN